MALLHFLYSIRGQCIPTDCASGAWRPDVGAGTLAASPYPLLVMAISGGVAVVGRGARQVAVPYRLDLAFI
ncbi:hypothetical protein GCM10023083_13300 [Streptomyces phyllanthi]